MKQKTYQSDDITELLLCIFLGCFGGHRFYRKKYGTAVLYFFTCGLFGVGWIYDFVVILRRMCRSVSDPEPVAQPEPPQAAPTPVSTPTASPRLPGKNHRIAGISKYKQAVLSLATENPDYDLSKREIIDEGLEEQKIWKYEFYPQNVELIPEPENPYDPHAIRVEVDGQLIGYIKAGSCSQVRHALDRGETVLDCEIGGGPYKLVYEDDEDYDSDSPTMVMDRSSIEFWATVTIGPKPEH